VGQEEHTELVARAPVVLEAVTSTIGSNSTLVGRTTVVGLLTLVSVALIVWATKPRGGGP